MILIIRTVIAGIPAYFLGKVFIGFLPPVPGLIKQTFFALWFLSMTILFVQQVTKLKLITQKWSLSRIPALVIAVFLSANIARFVPYTIPDENVIAIFRVVVQVTGIVIPLVGLKVVFAIVSVCTFLITLGTLFQLYEFVQTKVVVLVMSRRQPSSSQQQTRVM